MMLHTYYNFLDLYDSKQVWDLLIEAENAKDPRLKDSAASGKKVTELFSVQVHSIRKTLEPYFLAVKEANINSFGFDLYTNTPLTMNFNTYETGDCYPIHQDILQHGSPSDTKLTAILNVSTKNFEGGDLVLHLGKDKMIMESLRSPGALCVFPSYIFHEITPVTSGQRISATSWFLGPSWK